MKTCRFLWLMRAIGITITLLLIGITLCVIPACNSNQGATDLPPPTPPPDQGSTDLPPPPPPPERPAHWHPKLDSAISQLIDAEEQGDTELLDMAAQFGHIVDGGVRVVIECEPDQAEAVAEAAANVGAEIQGISSDAVSAVVPINKLTTLADIPGVHFVRLPVYPVPATSN